MALGIAWALQGIVFASFPTSFVIWGVLIWRNRDQGIKKLPSTLVPYQDQERPYWSPFDALVYFGIWIAATGIALAWVKEQGWLIDRNLAETPDQVVQVIWAKVGSDSFGKAAALFLTLIWLMGIRGGLSQKRPGLKFIANLKVGLWGALLILPPVLAINLGVSHIVEYKHTVLEDLKTAASPPLFLAMLGSTAVLTPIVEELQFRGLLQGGLQGFFDARTPDQPSAEPWRPRSYAPLLVTSVFFGLMHISNGAACIPLFFMAIGLGFIYRQTGSLVGPIVIHMILNAMTLCIQFSAINAGIAQ